MANWLAVATVDVAHGVLPTQQVGWATHNQANESLAML
jgi:hypothetical protein